MPICRTNTALNDNGLEALKVRYLLGAGGAEDEIGRKPERESDQDPPGRELFVPELAGDGEKLDDDIEDRTGGKGEERGEDRLVLERLADERAYEGRTTGDEPERAEETPAGH